ncbi:histidine kinase [Thermobaculum terrenum ATCC BAA-798]|uniref:histidine kinase n=1 Tax=Thermobaculum terrenum (strain ATCC BAA-798 / CCMEE 7001 / YNP1) TaxID=525904 RepID=D1CGX7_THET1|nr:ATP-binding protein [Thermobaculum terrenum]ACZ42998.1 histidine kinase [Thermobaculum terrenum ATCC BAA-798]
MREAWSTLITPRVAQPTTDNWQRLLRALSRYLFTVGSVALVTALIWLMTDRVRLANISMLYLLAVMVVAVTCGSVPAIIASVLSFLAFDFFFVQPTWSLTIRDPDEWLALLLFLITAIVTGQLAALLRRRAEEASRREREANLLYELLRVLGEEEIGVALESAAEQIRRELRLEGVGIEISSLDNGGPIRVFSGSKRARLQLLTLSGSRRYVLEDGAPTNGGAPRSTWLHVAPNLPQMGRAHRDLLRVVYIHTEGRRLGSINLVGGGSLSDADVRLLSAVAQQLGRTLERAALRRRAMEMEAIKRADELKTSLINAVSHDLRTPLATISAAADSLLRQDVEWSEEERRGFVRDIAEESRRLGRLVDNLLDMSRLEGGSLRPHKSWCDLGALVEETIDRLGSLTAHHQLHLEVEEDLPPVLLDYVEIGQVVSNLLENAIKYAPQGTTIDIQVRRQGDEVRVAIADRGPGIPPQDLSRIFDKFYRVQGSSPAPQGMGLGLSVAKGLIEAHGGRIWGENRPGGGAVFSFTLPLSPAGVPPPC